MPKPSARAAASAAGQSRAGWHPRRAVVVLRLARPDGRPGYSDVRPCLHTLHDAGYFVGIAGNQTTRADRFLRELNFPCDIFATSDDWGVTKPDIAFFTKLIAVSGHHPNEIAYIGDRLDNDLRPAAAAGLHTIFIKRGPWGYITYQHRTATLEINSLTELPHALTTFHADASRFSSPCKTE